MDRINRIIRIHRIKPCKAVKKMDRINRIKLAKPVRKMDRNYRNYGIRPIRNTPLLPEGEAGFRRECLRTLEPPNATYLW